MIALLLTNLLFADPWNPNEGPLVDELIDLNNKEEWVSARTKAGAYLDEHPDSMVGHMVMGRALWLGEGQHSRAMHHLGLAYEHYLDRYNALIEPPWKLQSEILYSMQSVAGDMGESEKELELIAQYNQLQDEFDMRFEESYSRLIGERGWPLMKLELYDEARLAARQAIETGRRWQVSLGHNVLCAVEAEEGRRAEAMRECEAALEHAEETGSGIPIDASNAANSAFAVLDFDRAESYSILATQHYGNTAPAWSNLVVVYMLQGRGEASIDAMKGFQQAQLNEPAHMRSQRRAEVDAQLAKLMLLSGETELALDKINRAILQPDRRGTISTSEAQTQGSHMLVRYVILRSHAERLAEKAAAEGWMSRMSLWLGSWFPDSSQVADAAGVRKVLTDNEYLSATFRMYLDKGLTGIPSWLMGDLIQVLGPGIAEAAIQEARAKDTFEGLEAYYQMMDAEVAFLRGDSQRVAQLAEQAYAALPMAEVLLQTRMLALQAWASEAEGQFDLAMARYEQVMQQDPSVLRRLQLSIPAKIQTDGSPIAEGIASGIENAPRIRYSPKGFTISVTGDAQPSMCLISPMGNQLGCAVAPPREEAQNDASYIVTACEAFHTGVFALGVGLSGAQWNSLDGTTVASKEAMREKMKSLIEQ
ncbi:MAG: hypothetical protein VXZ96_02030 [Myxococcota bacterium]|nr:hypothetical protein [Myxococcota bacterium]